MSLDKLKSYQVKMGLGSDVGAGRSFSLRKACARAYDASRISESPTTPEELLWYATRGGALALNRPHLGVIEKGATTDVICIQPPPSFDPQDSTSSQSTQSMSTAQQIPLNQLIAQLIFCEDWDGMIEVKTRGVTRWKVSE